MRTVTMVVVLSCAMVTGCSTGNGGGSGFRYTQAPQFERDMKDEHRHIVGTYEEKLGHANEAADEWSLRALHCPATGTNQDGPYTCNASCSQVQSCVHAWARWDRETTGTLMYAGVDPRLPIEWHEVLHLIQAQYHDDPAEIMVANGHPETWHYKGKLYHSRKFLPPGTRWPLGLNPVNKAIDWVADRVPWTDKGWEIDGCGWNESMYLGPVKPVDVSWAEGGDIPWGAMEEMQPGFAFAVNNNGASVQAAYPPAPESGEEWERGFLQVGPKNEKKWYTNSLRWLIGALGTWGGYEVWDNNTGGSKSSPPRHLSESVPPGSESAEVTGGGVAELDNVSSCPDHLRVSGPGSTFRCSERGEEK